jgi:hypothetical protein
MPDQKPKPILPKGPLKLEEGFVKKGGVNTPPSGQRPATPGAPRPQGGSSGKPGEAASSPSTPHQSAPTPPPRK